MEISVEDHHSVTAGVTAARRTAVDVASVPEFINRTRPQLGDSFANCFSEFHFTRGRRTVGGSVDGGSTYRLCNRWVSVTQNDRPETLYEVDVATTLNIGDVCTAGPRNDVWSSSH